MAFLTRVTVFLAAAAIVGVGVFLAMWDMPPPSTTIEKTIGNERFAR